MIFCISCQLYSNVGCMVFALFSGGSVLAQHVNMARGLGPHAKAESEVERSARRETMQALELSEQSVRSPSAR